jgi:hypothetical protein
LPLTDLVVSTATSKTLTGNLTLTGSINVQAGSLNLGTNLVNSSNGLGTVNVAAGAILSIGGISGGVGSTNFPSGYAAYTLSGTIDFNYAGNQTVPSGLPYTSLSFSNSGIKTISSALTVVGIVSVNTGATLTVTAPFDITGDLNNDGTINSNAAITVH